MPSTPDSLAGTRCARMYATRHRGCQKQPKFHDFRVFCKKIKYFSYTADEARTSDQKCNRTKMQQNNLSITLPIKQYETALFILSKSKMLARTTSAVVKTKQITHNQEIYTEYNSKKQ